MKLAVVGGGINGVMTAWALAARGHAVELFERGALMGATSSASSRMLHGGIRYLEQGHFSLVREALQERSWWLANAPHLTRKFPLLIPVYRGARRGRFIIGAGVMLYDFLARGSGFPRGRWLNAAATRARLPHLKTAGLLGAWEYWDAQMDDHALGLWAAGRAREAGVQIFEHSAVETVSTEGVLGLPGEQRAYDCIINAAGPWAGALLAHSGIASPHQLDLVRGSHLLIHRRVDCGAVLQDAASRRVIFVLPAGEHALLGTTEVLQEAPETASPSNDEIALLRAAYEAAFDDALAPVDIARAFSGVRPVVRAGANFSAASRESLLERQGRLITVFGGKWTSARVLGERVAALVGA